MVGQSPSGKATMTIMIEDMRRLSGNFLCSGRGIPYKEGNFFFSTFFGKSLGLNQTIKELNNNHVNS
jgi:hypothetical protein